MILDCVAIARKADASIVAAAERLRARGVAPRLCEVLATNNEGAVSYSATKRRKAEALHVDYVCQTFEPDVHLDEVRASLEQLNQDDAVHGIVLGMPTYPHLDSEALLGWIAPHKDVDGLGPSNSYYLFSNQEHLSILPATAVAAIEILETQTSVSGKNVVVIGRGRTVGRPVAAMLVNRDATVTICHSRTPQTALAAAIETSDIVIAATGAPGILRSEWFHAGQIVIDCGIAFIEGKTTGDVNAATLSDRGVLVTPVPRGVGQVTNSIIFANLLRAVSLNDDDIQS